MRDIKVKDKKRIIGDNNNVWTLRFEPKTKVFTAENVIVKNDKAYIWAELTGQNNGIVNNVETSVVLNKADFLKWISKLFDKFSTCVKSVTIQLH